LGSRYGTSDCIHLPSRVAMSYLGISLLGLKFSGTLAVVAVVIVVVAIGAVWFLMNRRP